MSLKRKFTFVDDTESMNMDAPLLKQIRLVPFPNSTTEEDVCMSDAQYEGPYHSRFTSTVSDASSISPATSPAFSQNTLPLSTTDANHFPDQHSPSASPVGLLQPSSSFAHHGTSCNQIPKLKVACAAGSNGQRTMWSFCEQCGAISMVDDGSSS
ncbi:hypothetical protein MIND_00049300 [Mycena indigotica]|uniref:Uncharacterized protein n=1 Tax=Mycena indigotica TaxID=2126181 RepID=A0A8H6WF04_9AGAR|nr:uncharacterized protein MIND_00049300 [Mycena indigotica]KAF7315347.1 hypothetical protein MIND_00049300 [Mycena indigotica]